MLFVGNQGVERSAAKETIYGGENGHHHVDRVFFTFRLFPSPGSHGTDADEGCCNPEQSVNILINCCIEVIDSLSPGIEETVNCHLRDDGKDGEFRAQAPRTVQAKPHQHPNEQRQRTGDYQRPVSMKESRQIVEQEYCRKDAADVCEAVSHVRNL